VWAGEAPPAQGLDDLVPRRERVHRLSNETLTAGGFVPGERWDHRTMRIVVVGATGNVGTSLVGLLTCDPSVDWIVGVARRHPDLHLPKTEWRTVDIVDSNLVELFRGADAVVHLAWLIQPSRNRKLLWRTNVEGSSRVFAAVAQAQVPTLVYASSVGAYSPGPKDRRVSEAWPTNGVPRSLYSVQKAEVERRLNRFEHEHPRVRTVRLRPGLIFKREAATEVRRLFVGPLLPSPLVAPPRIRVLPDLPGLRVQAVHATDVADAYRRAILGEASGAFNIAAEPVLDPAALGDLLEARRIRVNARLARAAVQISYGLHLQPTEPGWLDMALAVPLLDTTRARTELGWAPTRSSGDALRELLAGMAEGAGTLTPPLDPASSGPLRLREFLTGIGSKSV
jgi:UDP-glucose 4-epimerase